MKREAVRWITPLVLLAAFALLVSCSSEGETAEPADKSLLPSEPTCRQAIDIRPTYLPWVETGGSIPDPVESYDAEIDRAQLAWRDHQGDGLEVGLTLYPHTPLGNFGEPAEIRIDGVEGYLHLQDEGGLIGIWWDLPGSRCNYLELVLSFPRMPKRQAVDQLLRIAASLRPE